MSPSKVDWLQDTYATSNPRFPIIGAVCSELQEGIVWGAIDADNPWVVVIHQSGFCQALFKHPPQRDETAELAESLVASDSQELPNYLMWYCPTPDMLGNLNRLKPPGFRVRSRMRWQYRQPDPPHHSLPTIANTDSSEYVALSTRLVRTAGESGLVNLRRFWKDAETFSERALPFGHVTNDSKVNSICYAAAVHLLEAEVDVATMADVRCKGHAKRCASAFIGSALKRGITPLWDCFVNNEASMNLAMSLGFTPCGEYPFATLELTTRR